jgi:hypothetical protein
MILSDNKEKIEWEHDNLIKKIQILITSKSNVKRLVEKK